ncbi:MAG TPA: glycine/sarcosine/betaine reductase selenoprotein B family protein [Anaerolineae bacterium]|nr:glycine/sarcosine/betaine reductase selenoprotein B family protein [Anaerolineae bacterium]
MTSKASQHEAFEAFKNSFSYGSRTDLNFKFLKSLSDQDAARFFQDLLWKMGDSFDDGDLDRLVEHVYEWQIRGYSGAKRYAYQDGPFTLLRKPISESRLVLLTSSGHFVEGQDPEPFGVKNMTQKEAIDRIGEFARTEPQLSSIPIDTPRERLRVRHGGYDIRAAQADPNVAFPLDRLVELRNEGLIGELLPEAYSFVGATSQTRLLKQAGPKWVKMLTQQQIDAALLVPV